MTNAANANIMLERPAGCGTNYQTLLVIFTQHEVDNGSVTFSRLRSVSKIKPGSGRSWGGRAVPICTLLAYGVFALPISGSDRLLPEPSALRQAYLSPTYVLGGCGRSLYTEVVVSSSSRV